MDDLAGFFFTMMNHPTKHGVVYYLSHNIINNAINDKISYVKKIMKSEIEVNENKKQLYDYQEDIISNYLVPHFKNNTRGILNMPCGTGKTIVSCHFANNYKHVIIISPLKQFAEQNMQRFKEYKPTYDGLLIDSDGTRDIAEIITFIESNKNREILLSATFKSIDIIYQIIGFLGDHIIIVDEFHNLSRNNILNEGDDFCRLLHSNHRILFLSTTPRIYDLEGTVEDDTYEDIFGKIVSRWILVILSRRDTSVIIKYFYHPYQKPVQILN